ncbi:prepilin-type N-terminal cleavage/methylation domain-containing protein [Firmicutes bacterium M10-2]|nr:prepilin-type N-terminal cleavage/methylation domain-containing protein [Firmicutes bacterium M10-2]
MKKAPAIRSKRSKKNGFTMIEVLLALMITTICMGIGMAYLQTAQKLLTNHDSVQRDLMILQLRYFLASSSSIDTFDDHLEVVVRHEQFTIEKDKDRLIKRGGYEILEENVDDVRFFEHEEGIFMEMDDEIYQLY